MYVTDPVARLFYKTNKEKLMTEDYFRPSFCITKLVIGIKYIRIYIKITNDYLVLPYFFEC